MDFATVKMQNGNINIYKTTIETIVRDTLKEIKGIYKPKISVLKNIGRKIKKNNQEKLNLPSQEIRIEIKPGDISLSLFLIIYYGIRIPDLTWEIQAKVKEKIKEITFLDISNIDVHIQGIRYPHSNSHKDILLIPEVFLIK